MPTLWERKLAPELWCNIAEHLLPNDCCRLNQAKRYLHSLTKPILYCSVVLVVTDYEPNGSPVHTTLQLLATDRNIADCVRSLTVCMPTFTDYYDLSDDEMFPLITSHETIPVHEAIFNLKMLRSLAITGCFVSSITEQSTFFENLRQRDVPLEEFIYDDGGWDPVFPSARIDLPGLQRLTWGSFRHGT